jgi:hypothetical protein
LRALYSAIVIPLFLLNADEAIAVTAYDCTVAKPVEFGEAQTVQTFEHLMRTHLRPSLRRREVTFNLQELRSIGLLPATLFYCWVAQLREGSRTDVVVELPPRDVLANSDARVLLDADILQKMSLLGARIPYDSPSVTSGVPLAVLTDGPHETLLESVADQLRRASPEVGEDMVRDLCHGVLFDLLENAIVHGGAKSPYFVVRNASARAQDPFLPAFAPAESYFELAVGDLGAGVYETLAAHMPADYQPPFTIPDITEQERVICYAFEYGSTSSAAARRERFRSHLRDAAIDPNRVATGLSCVLNVVRDRHGQLIIRSSGVILSIDYWKGSTPTIRTAKQIMNGEAAPVRGTQYLLRLPARRLSLRTGFSVPIPESALLDRIEVVRPFDVPAHSSDEADRLSAAIDYMAQHFSERVNTLGLSIIRPSRMPLTSRGRALFGAALTMQNRGVRHLLCLEPYTGESESEKLPNTRYVPPPSHDAGVVLEGDLFRNTFHNVRRAATDVPGYLAVSDGGPYQLNNVIVPKARAVLARSIRSDLQTLLRSPAIRLEDGPFLIEGQYYTNAFYSVAEAAIGDPYHAELLAQWVASVVPPDVDTLIAVTRPVIPLAWRVQALVYDMRQVRLRIVTEVEELIRKSTDEEWVCVALTDVICRGAVLNASLSVAQPAIVSGVVTLVDSRPGVTDADILEYSAGGTTKRTKVWSIVRDPLQTYGSFAEALAARGIRKPSVQSEQIAISFPPTVRIIDPTIHRPTVYVRTDEPVGDFNKLLDAAKKADALLYRHAVHYRRHYAIFLHFPRLFRNLRSEIEQWLDAEIKKTTVGIRRRCVIVDTDGGLSWLRPRLQEIHPRMLLESVGWDDIRAPRPPSRGPGTREHCFILIPGSASGDLARRAVEYVSRTTPASIILMIIVARMEPSHLSFLLGVSEYRGIPFRATCFARFPVRAYPDALSCPLCAAHTEIERVREAAPQSLLLDVLQRKTDALAPIDVNSEVDERMFAASDEDVRKSRLRALYEASEYDLHARAALTKCLESDILEVDSFLEVIAVEYRSDHFSIPMVRRRLLSTFDRVLARVSDLLLHAVPPVPLAAKLPALVHLAEDLFVVAAPRLLREYRASWPDMEELCIALVRLRALPAVELTPGEAAAPGDSQALLLATIDFLKRPAYADDAAAFVRKIEMLWARLVRSSLVTERIPKFQAAASRKQISLARMELVARHVYDGWTAELSELLARLLRNRHWREFAKRHTRIADDVTYFAQRMNDIRQVANGASGTPANMLRELSADVDRVRQRLANHIRRLFISPLYCAAARYPVSFTTSTGGEIRLTKDIDYDVPVVFADLETLNDVCEEIKTNWQKHSGSMSPRVRVRIRRADEFVVLELSDDIPGDVKRLSAGGMRVIEEFCEAYAGAFECTEDRDEDGMKTISLFLRVQSVEA